VHHCRLALLLKIGDFISAALFQFRPFHGFLFLAFIFSSAADFFHHCRPKPSFFTCLLFCACLLTSLLPYEVNKLEESSSILCTRVSCQLQAAVSCKLLSAASCCQLQAAVSCKLLSAASCCQLELLEYISCTQPNVMTLMTQITKVVPGLALCST
jgi:hypothetical protein